MNKAIVLIFLLLAAAYLVSVPIVSLASTLLLHLLAAGFVARLWLGKTGNSPILESILLSLVFTTAAGLVIGNFFTVADLSSRTILLGMVILVAWAKKEKIEPAWTEVLKEWQEEGKTLAGLVVVAAVPFLIIFLANPTYTLISDGWWHCSIYNTVKLGTLPPANPWYANEALGYPYAYHVYLAYATAGTLNCFDGLNLFDFLATVIAMLGIYALAKETFGDRKIAMATALAFLFISHIGGMGFLYDGIRILPAQGVSGYMEFLKSVHGPHVYYGHLEFLGFSGIVIPFQMASMMGGFHFPLLLALLYFLWKRRAWIVGIVLGTLVATNPVVGILGTLTATIFVLAIGDWKKINAMGNWILAAVLALLVASNYALALWDKTNAVGGELIGSLAQDVTLPGFLLGYLPLLVLTVAFFLNYRRVPTRMAWISFLVAAIVAIVFIRKGTAYIYTDLMVLLAIASGPWLIGIWNEPRKRILEAALVLMLVIPTFLVVGSYSYYKIPLNENELEAAGWLRENTPEDSVVLAGMDLEKPWNLHQYAAVFGKRKVYLGDPMLLRIYGEDTEPALRVYRSIIEQKNPEAICRAKENGIDYVYVKQGPMEIANPCLDKEYEKDGIIIYKTLR